MSTDAQRDLADSWLRLADEDLYTAEKLLSPPNPICTTAVYHCQQAAEKAAKALLALYGEDIPLKHDIGHILENLEKHNAAVNQFQVAAERLTIFATEYRYPKPNAIPLTQDAVDIAVRDASSIVQYARSLIPLPSKTGDGEADGAGGGAAGGPAVQRRTT